ADRAREGVPKGVVVRAHQTNCTTSALGHKRTFALHQPMSAKGQKRTSAILVNHLVSPGEESLRHAGLDALLWQVRFGSRAYPWGEPYFPSALIAFCRSTRIRCAEPTLSMVGSR